MIYVLLFLVFILILNRAMLKVRINSKNEAFIRDINKKIAQNRKLDELYGREPTRPEKEIERAIFDLAKSKEETS